MEILTENSESIDLNKFYINIEDKSDSEQSINSEGGTLPSPPIPLPSPPLSLSLYRPTTRHCRGNENAKYLESREARDHQGRLVHRGQPSQS